MENLLKVLVIFFSLISFAAGFYIANGLQNQIQVLIGAAIVISFLTWLGSGADFIGLIREWYKDQKQEKSIGELKYGNIIKITRGVFATFYLQVNNNRPGTILKDCQASLTTKEYSVLQLYWRSNNDLTVSISLRDEITLFSIVDDASNKRIAFKTSPTELHYLSYEEFENKEIQITFIAETGNLPKLYYETTVKEIVNNAIEEKSFTV